MTNGSWTYIWEYEVRPGAEAAFLTHYNGSGTWVRLFRRAPGYLRTDLYRDRKRPSRFITLDHWETEAAFQEFRQRFAREFDELDRSCEQLTLRETLLGQFLAERMPGDEEVER